VITEQLDVQQFILATSTLKIPKHWREIAGNFIIIKVRDSVSNGCRVILGCKLGVVERFQPVVDRDGCLIFCSWNGNRRHFRGMARDEGVLGGNANVVVGFKG
jgi:hypothetical protein